MPQKKPKNQEKKTKSLNDYARYSNLGFQMLAVLLVGVFGGMRIDKWLKLKFPVFTVVLSIVAMILSLYLGTKEFLKRKND